MMQPTRLFIFFSVGVLFLNISLNGAAHAYWVSQNDRLMWYNGQVLGIEDKTAYTYVVRAKLKIAPTGATSPSNTLPTLALTPAPTLAFTFPLTPSPTIIEVAALQNFAGQGQKPNLLPNKNNSQTHSSTSSSSSFSSLSLSSFSSSSSSNQSQNSFGSFDSSSSICIIVFPTATPYNRPAGEGFSAPAQMLSSSSQNNVAFMPPTLTSVPTHMPYPTQAPKKMAFINSVPSGSTSSLPTPTPIPEILRGKSSTIVIEMPTPDPAQRTPFTIVPAPTSIILKGEEMRTIKIDLPKEEVKTSNPENPSISNSNLDITIERKRGDDIAIQQQEFVIQRGMQTVIISTNEQRQGTLTIEKNDTKARITMPISINPTTNILTVDTKSGPMKVSIMPDDALSIIRQLKVVDKSGVPQDIILESRNNQLQYRIRANKQERLLWVIPITVPKDVYVAADTGGLIEIKLSPFYDFLTLFTF